MKQYETASETGCYDLWQLHLERNKLAQEYIDRWAATGIDGILSPTTPYSTVEHGKFRHVGYTGIWNILDYSAVTFPSGFVVDKAIDGWSSGFVPMSQLDTETHDECEWPFCFGHSKGSRILLTAEHR
jgi:amidase